MWKIKIRFMQVALWCLEAIMIKLGTGLNPRREIKMDTLENDIENKLKEE